MLRTLVLLLIAVLAGVQYQLWFGRGGVHDVRRLNQAVDAQKQENAQSAERNRKLWTEVQDLRQGFEAVEERARVELGMVRPEETFYQVVTERKVSAP
jgi:cell division protein FtsB